MSDIVPGARPTDPSPNRGDQGKPPAQGRPGPRPDDPPTVISNRPVISTSGLSDSACRILQGKILPGDRLEHFELLDYIGGGGMGRVFRGVDTRLRRDVALKILSPDHAADEETLLRFQNEAQSAARLDHENIARVYHVGEDRGLHYIAFEYISGVNIRRLLEQRGPLSLAEAVDYTLQVAEALVHADARNVVHRDIKPSNLLITPDGQVKLIDMGLARLRRLGSSSGDLTQSGVTLGTFDYIAPEQARDPRNADVRSDIYSLGCTFFFMLTGHPPFPEGTMLQKLLQHQDDRPPDIRESRPDLPDEVPRLLRKMMAKDPRHRHHDPTELVDELRLLAYQIGLRTTSRSDEASAARQRRTFSLLQRHLPWSVPVAALLCIVLGIHLFAQQGDPSPPWPDPPPAADGSELPGTPGPDGQLPLPQLPDAEPPEQTAASTVEPPAGSLLPGPAAGGAQLADLPEDTSPPLVAEQPPTTPSEAPGTPAGTGPLAGSPGSAAQPGSGDSVPAYPGLLVVTGDPLLEGGFATLEEACRAAIAGDEIELRYNGRLNEQPITLPNLALTIRAAEGYQPVVVFQPSDPDPQYYDQNMLTLTAGQLTLVDLAIELYVPRQIRDYGWSLFGIRGNPQVRLERCSLSICNASDRMLAYQSDVAFFRTAAPSEADILPAPQASADVPPATIELEDCIARGEAVFLSANDLQPVHLIWQNGLLATTEQLLQVFASPRELFGNGMLQVELRRLTAVTYGGLCRTTQTQFALNQLFTQIDCADSILISSPDAPLIDQEGADSPLDLRRQFFWIGSRNFYEDFHVFWRVRSFQAEPEKPMSFQDWQNFWQARNEYLPMIDSVIWDRLPDPSRALHTHVPADYALAESTSGYPNPAQGAGLQADRLPQHPVPPGT